MNWKFTLVVGLTFAFLGVCFGAFGAHALKGLLTANQRGETYELAVRYQFYHAFALIITGLLQRQDFRGRVSSWLFTAGIMVFSGSLYILAVTGVTWWGAITPIGGIFLIAGWASLIIAVIRKTA
jgi:uncharacterized membrane protein YgdD (TMEM256/DUF423 family)